MTEPEATVKWELANDKPPCREGSDSGVEAPMLVRELSNNSNDYASSGIGHENEGCTTSCTSSMISCSSDFPTEETVKPTDCASEGGSESSSIHAEKIDKNGALIRRRLNFKAQGSPSSTSSDKRNSSGPPNLLTSERARSRDKPVVAKKPTTLPIKAISRVPPKPKTPNTPSTDDGRWPSTNNMRTPTTLREASVTRSMSMSSKGSKCATLPRRRRDPDDLMTRSSSVSRNMSASMHKPPRTKIYHELGIQTCLTLVDLERSLNGESVSVLVHEAEKATRETQTDIRDKEIEALKAKMKELLGSKTILETNLRKEQDEKVALRREMAETSQKITSLVEPFSNEKVGPEDALVILEMQLKSSEKVIRLQTEEIKRLQATCCGLHQDLEKALAAQQSLSRQKGELEEESNELHEFLQAEKIAFVEALKESEVEVEGVKQKLVQKEADLESKTEECHHLVRVSEQRRQEILGLQAKCFGLENRCKELLCQQGTLISGASGALAELGSRLELLVEQIIKSYEITGEELDAIEAVLNPSEDEVAAPEAPKKPKTRSEASLSPQRNKSFITAVLNAIKNATSSGKGGAKQGAGRVEDKSDSTEMLDSETEPCLMMDNVLEDVTMPDSHTQNLISSSQLQLQLVSHIEMPPEMYRQDDSLSNLQDAIANRQQMELQASRSPQKHTNGHHRGSTSEDLSANDSYMDMPSISEFCTAHALVDQVFDLDHLLTKLLKVLHIVQVNSDSCIRDLMEEKEKLTTSTEESPDVTQLRKELTEATAQLVQKSNELLNCKFDLQRHRLEIDKLNEDICKLSTLCSSVPQDSAKEAPNVEIITESPSWKQAILEAKRQYEAIDQALETLHSIQSVVEQNPALKELQQNLEDTNFAGATSLPLLNAVLAASVCTPKPASSDLNANPTETVLNMLQDGSQAIDSTA